MNRFVEIRSYSLKPGSTPALDKLMIEQAVPMLMRWQVDVVGWGASLDEPDSYYLMRAYDSVATLHASQDAFYGSDEWLQGPREAILALIDHYTSIVLEVDEAALEGLRRLTSQ